MADRGERREAPAAFAAPKGALNRAWGRLDFTGRGGQTLVLTHLTVGDSGRRKSDSGKPAMAARLRRETTLPVGWIANRLRIRTRKSMSSKLHRWRSAARRRVRPGPRPWFDPSADHRQK